MGLEFAPFLFYGLAVLVLSLAAPGFLRLENFLNILVQCSAVAVGAIGMTLVLLTAGIDLSVGSVMFLSSSVAGVLVVHAGWPVAAVLPVMVLVGVLVGSVNGYFIARKGMVPFIVTLAMLFVARGTGLWITQTRAVNLPDQFRELATARTAGIPTPVLVLAGILFAGHLLLTRTVFGRHLYAVGSDAAAAAKAGVPVIRVLMGAYVLCGAAAGIAGMITLAQLAAVSPNLGQGRELDVIAAAVLGGTSLFGGRGTASGAVLGALMVETVRNGMNLMDADPYFYPIIIGWIIFLAVLLDSARHRRLEKMRRAV